MVRPPQSLEQTNTPRGMKYNLADLCFEVVLTCVSSLKNASTNKLRPLPIFRFHNIRYGHQKNGKFKPIYYSEFDIFPKVPFKMPEHLKDDMARYMPNLTDSKCSKTFQMNQWKKHLSACGKSNTELWSQLHKLGARFFDQESISKSLAREGILVGSYYTTKEFVAAVERAIGFRCLATTYYNKLRQVTLLKEIRILVDLNFDDIPEHVSYNECKDSLEVFLYESLPMRRAREHGKLLRR